MTDKLFETPESLSPREKWKRNWNITSNRSDEGEKWAVSAWRAGSAWSGVGETEDGAFDDLVKRMILAGVAHWKTDPDCQ